MACPEGLPEGSNLRKDFLNPRIYRLVDEFFIQAS